MREEYEVLSGTQGGPLALSGVYIDNDTLRILFETGSTGEIYFATQVKVNGMTLCTNVLLQEKNRSGRVFSADLRKVPSFGDGFEHLFEITLKVKSENHLLSGTVSCVYDISSHSVSSLTINGKMLSQDQMRDWNSENSQIEEQTPLEQLLSQLYALPGLGEVKEEIRSSINMNRLQKIRRDRGFCAIDLSLHMVFTGNPGTGKTTLARLLAKIYKEAGILSRGQFVEADRSTLVSHYIGGTAVKTGRVVDSAIGGILFIDEAYSLADGQDGKDYGREAITTLLKKMEDHREDLIVIVAGYPEKMEKFLDSNPGFRSRFNRFIRFRDYSSQELTEIFLYECRKYGLVPEKGIDTVLLSYFQKLILEKDPYFANGRTVRNLFEQTLVHQANRFEGRSDISNQELMLLKMEDLPQSVTAGRQRHANIA